MVETRNDLLRKVLRDKPGETRHGNILDRLSPEEARSALRVLLKNRPELIEETCVIARELIDAVSPEEVAEDVRLSVLAIGYDEMNGTMPVTGSGFSLRTTHQNGPT